MIDEAGITIVNHSHLRVVVTGGNVLSGVILQLLDLLEVSLVI